MDSFEHFTLTMDSSTVIRYLRNQVQHEILEYDSEYRFSCRVTYEASHAMHSPPCISGNFEVEVLHRKTVCTIIFLMQNVIP